MAEHSVISGEPVLIAQGITVLVGLGAGALGITLDDGTVTVIAAVAWVLISGIATAVAHSRVAPIKGSWWVQVRDIVEQVVQDVVSTQLNLTAGLGVSGQPSYVPPTPPTTPTPLPPPAAAERGPRPPEPRYRPDHPHRPDTATFPRPRP
jgi:hypothetical protein